MGLLRGGAAVNLSVKTEFPNRGFRFGGRLLRIRFGFRFDFGFWIGILTFFTACGTMNYFELFGHVQGAFQGRDLSKYDLTYEGVPIVASPARSAGRDSVMARRRARPR